MLVCFNRSIFCLFTGVAAQEITLKRLIILIVMLLGGCAHQAGNNGVNSQQCKAVQGSCRYDGVYDEWIRKDGEISCSCRRI